MTYTMPSESMGMGSEDYLPETKLRGKHCYAAGILTNEEVEDLA